MGYQSGMYGVTEAQDAKATMQIGLHSNFLDAIEHSVI